MTSECISIDLIELYALGRVHDEMTEACLEEHLLLCPMCQELVEAEFETIDLIRTGFERGLLHPAAVRSSGCDVTHGGSYVPDVRRSPQIS